MNGKLLRTLAFCTTVLAGTAFAQQSQDPTSTTPRSGKDSTSTTAGRDSTYSSTAHRSSDASQPLRASKLMGAKVKTSAGEQLGTIEDVVVNPQSGRVDFAILSVRGGHGSGATATTSDSTTTTDRPATTTTPDRSSATASVGSDNKLYPVPWKVLSAAPSMQRGILGTEQISFTANIDRSKLQAAPSFEKSTWPDMTQQTWSQQVYTHYGVDAEIGTGGTGAGSIDSTGSSKKSSSSDSSTDRNKSSDSPSSSPNKSNQQ